MHEFCAARAAVTAAAERPVSAWMTAELSAAPAAAARVLRATRSSSTAHSRAACTRPTGTTYAAASLSAAADVVLIQWTSLATTATGDDNAIDQTITALPNIGRATSTESIVISTVHAAVGATIKSAGDPGRPPPDEDRQCLSGSNGNNRKNATTVTALAAFGARSTTVIFMSESGTLNVCFVPVK